MENVLTSVGLQLSVVAGLLLIVGYTIYRFAYAPFQLLKQCGIKGPKVSPLFGNYRQMNKLGWMSFYAELIREYGPVCGFYIGYQPCVLVADLEMLKQVMAGEYESFLHRKILMVDLMIDMAQLPKSVFGQKGEEWKRQRQILSPTISAKKVKMMAPLVKVACDSLVEKMGECASSDKSVDVLKIYGLYTMESVISCFFGRKINLQKGEGDELTGAVAAVFNQTHENEELSLNIVDFILSNYPFVTPLLAWLLKKTPGGRGMLLLKEIVIKIVDGRKESGKSGKYQDILQLMIDAEAEQVVGAQARRTLTDGEIASNTVNLIAAGYETTANALAYTSYLLALHPSVQDRLHSEIEEYFENNPETNLYDATKEMQYLDMILKEALRMYPPIPRMWRECLKTTEINGVTIPKGTVVHIPYYFLHHNPEYWPDPERFDPERFTPEEKAKRPNLSHMPFGWGPLNCIGMRFALLEAKMALIEILRKYMFVQAPDTEVPLQTIAGLTLTARNGVYLKIMSRD